MKKYFTLPFVLLLAVAAHSQTYVSGFINANTTWNMAGSPYIVNGNALLSHGYTLTIDPGVVVKFDTNRTLQIDGELHAIGTAANRITFTSLQASPKAGDWGKIHFSDTCVDAVFDTSGHYVSGTIMKYCDVIYAGGVGYGAVHIEGSSPYLNNCKLLQSKASGLYITNPPYYTVDSSRIKDCAEYGLYFNGLTNTSCGLSINSDSIENCKSGGIYFSNPSGNNCISTISKNYFFSNSKNGAILCYGGFSNLKIVENYFVNDTANNLSIGNYGIISVPSGGSGILISNNYFIGNSVETSYSGVIIMGGIGHTIECNKFINNSSGKLSYSAIRLGSMGNCNIRNNLFDGNFNNAIDGGSVAYIYVSNSLNGDTYFVNNLIQNNNSPLNNCCKFLPDYNNFNNTRSLHINNNSFKNNLADNVICFELGGTSLASNKFLDLTLNNFSNPQSKYELYNKIPYGSPNVEADSNYWGSTNTQHIDSIIYDYFDNGNMSVVYYQPILIHAVEIDTTCPASFPNIITELKVVDGPSKPFPNPFSTYTEITLGKELKDASLQLFNVFGQKVREITAINGKHISLRREALPSGIYIYEIIEKGQRIANGKLVAE